MSQDPLVAVRSVREKPRTKRPPVVAPVGAVMLRRRRRRIVESVLVLIGCVLLGDAIIGERGLVAMMRAREDYRRQESVLEAERLETVKLQEEVNLLREDRSTIEDVARRDLGLIKPGEKVFTIKDVAPAGTGH